MTKKEKKKKEAEKTSLLKSTKHAGRKFSFTTKITYNISAESVVEAMKSLILHLKVQLA